MKLAQLFSEYKHFKMGEDPLAEVRGLALDSRAVGVGQVFIAIRGQNRDSHEFIAEVCAQGVAGVVVENDENVPRHFRGGVLVVPNSREALVRLAARFYDYPARDLYCVGVTGTNGKTSTTYMIEAVLNGFGLNTGVLGTIDHHLGEHSWQSQLTTPDAVTLQKRLHEFRALGAKAVAMEVSSHALVQERAAGVPFQCGVFTNLTRDHLDYHGTMEDYFHAKEKLFLEGLSRQGDRVHAVVNANDPSGQKLRVAPHATVWTYGEVKSDFQFQVQEIRYSGSRFRLLTPRGDAEVKIKMPGRHNVYNAVAAIAVGMAAGASLASCVSSIEGFGGVPGRLQSVPNERERFVFVDYAHTDDALRSVLSILGAIRAQSGKRSQIVTVFGCGGDRDKGKRPLMAKAAIEGSDMVFITTDNPRTEDPLAIIQDILSGVPKELMNTKVFVEVDRKEAIRKAIAEAGPRDAILIAGKGHEPYQIVGTTKLDFSDLQVAGELLNGM